MFLHHFQQSLRLEWLDQELGRARHQAAHLVEETFPVAVREHDDRQLPRLRLFPQGAAEIVAIGIRHADVHQDEVRRARFLDEFESVMAVDGLAHLVTAAGQGHGDELADGRAIVDYQYGRARVVFAVAVNRAGGNRWEITRTHNHGPALLQIGDEPFKDLIVRP